MTHEAPPDIAPEPVDIQRGGGFRPPRAVVTAAILIAITVGFYWKLVLTNQYTWMESPDIVNQVLPWLQMEAGEVKSGRPPLWNPYTWGGQPIVGLAQPGAMYPLNWLLFLAPTKGRWIPQAVLHWYFVVIHFMALLFAYRLCRDLQLPRGPSLVGSMVFAFGAILGNLSWPQMLNGAVWAPLVLMFLLRVGRGERPMSNAIRGGAALGVSILSGHHQIPMYIALMSAGLLGWFTLGRLRLWIAAAAFVATAGLVGSAQILPAQEYSKIALRWVGLENPVGDREVVPYNIHEQFSIPPENLFGVLIPSMWLQISPYVGVAAFSLIILALVLASDRREVRIAAIVCAAGLLFALGAHTPFHGVIYALSPAFLKKARSPSMAVAIFSTGAALLTAFGLHALAAARTASAVRSLRNAAITLAGLLFAAMFLAHLLRPETGNYTPLSTALYALLIAAVLWMWQAGTIPPATLAAAFGVVCFLELGTGISILPHHLQKNYYRGLAALAGGGPIAESHRYLNPPGRIDMSDQDITYSYGEFFGREAFHGSGASHLTRLYEIHPWEPWVKQLYGVRYLLAKEPDGDWNQLIVNLPEDRKIFANPNVMPQAWAVAQARRVASLDEARTAINNKSLDIQKTAFFLDPPPDLPACPGPAGDAWAVQRAPMRTELIADLKCEALVVLSDNQYPGWSVTVDGRPATPYQPYATLRGVVVPAGRHWIEWTYRPMSVYAGTLLTIVGLVLTFFARRLDGPTKL